MGILAMTNAMHELDTVERLCLTELNDHDENAAITDYILMSTRVLAHRSGYN